MLKHVYPLTCLLSFIVVFTSILLPVVKVHNESPDQELYGFPMSFMGDYYTNIYRIRLGQEGIFSYIDAYTDEPIPDTVFEPHYNIVGFLSKPFGITPLQTYEIFRLLSISVFLLAVYTLIYFILPTSSERIMACVFFTFATSIWKIESGGGPFDIVSPLLFPPVYSTYFSVFQRFNVLKAHHYLAQASFIAIFLLFIHRRTDRKLLIISGALAFCLSFLHPYLLMYSVFFLGIYTVISLGISRKVPFSLLSKLVVIGAASAPVIVYHAYVLKNLFKADVDINGTLVWTKNMMSPSTYVLALGLVVFLAIPGLFMPQTWKHAGKRIIAIWGFFPFLYFLSNSLGVPTSNDRIFQTYQIIPLAIMASYSVTWILKRLKIPVIAGSSLICLLFMLYSIPSYTKSFSDATSLRQNYFYIQNIRIVSLPVYTFFREHSEKWSVVLGGENFSTILPVYSDNKVLIGHPGTTPNFEQKLSFAKQVFWGQFPVDNLHKVLKKYKVKYIVFGIENGSFRSSPYTQLPFLKEVYIQQNNGVSVVEVL